TTDDRSSHACWAPVSSMYLRRCVQPCLPCDLQRGEEVREFLDPRRIEVNVVVHTPPNTHQRIPTHEPRRPPCCVSPSMVMAVSAELFYALCSSAIWKTRFASRRSTTSATG